MTLQGAGERESLGTRLLILFRSYFLDIRITTMYCINSKCHTFGIHYSYQQSRSQHLLPHSHHFPQCTARLKKTRGNETGQSHAIKIFLCNMANWSGFQLSVVIPKLKVSIQPITEDANNTVNQSNSEVVTCS